MTALSSAVAQCRAELESALELLLERVADSQSSPQALECAAARCSEAFEDWVRNERGDEAERAELARRLGLVLRIAQSELERTGARLERATAVQRALAGRSVASEEPQRCDHRG
jgi:hypothetical protein